MPASVQPASHFAWHALGAPAWPPPEPTRAGRARFGPDAACWLCGGPTDGAGWPRALATPDTFTNHNAGALPSSTTTCQPCIYTSQAAAWEHYVTTRSLPLRASKVISWRAFSHLFTADAHAVLIRRADARPLLLDPPEPPFLLVLATSKQKHLIFRSRVAYSRAAFPVQLEEDTLIVDRAAFVACLADVEAALAAGFTRDEVERGQYSQGRLLKLGASVWRAAEQAVAPWRRGAPSLLRLALYVSVRPEIPVPDDAPDDDPATVEPPPEEAGCTTASTATIPTSQPPLF